MKHLILTFAAFVAALTVLPPGDAASAQGRGRGAENRQERGVERGRGAERQRGPQRERRFDRDRGERRGLDRRAEEYRPRDTRPALGYERREREDRRGGRWDDDDAPRVRSPRGYDGGPSTTRQRGFSGGYRGPVVEDYRRYRLRPPPHGYAWVRMGDGFALISLDDGQIFDRVR